MLPCRTLIPGVSAWVDGNKKTLAILSALCLCSVPWIQISKAVSARVAVSPLSLAAVVAAGAAIHVGYLIFNSTAAALFQLGGTEPVAAAKIRRAVVLVTSQKTLPVAVTLLAAMSAQLGEGAGLAVLPCVFCHLVQAR